MVNKYAKVYMTFIGILDDLQFLTDIVSVKMVSPSKILLETTHCAHHVLNELHSLNYIQNQDWGVGMRRGVKTFKKKFF